MEPTLSPKRHQFTMDQARAYVMQLARDNNPASLADLRQLIRTSDRRGQEVRLTLAMHQLVDGGQLRVDRSYRLTAVR